MPVVTYHLARGRHEPVAVAELLRRSSALLARVLDSPIERIRAFAQELPSTHVCIGGSVVADGAPDAPFFQLILMAARSREQRDLLLAGCTDLVVEVLGAERSLVRGYVVPVEAADWSIGGVPASVVRADEVRARDEQRQIRIASAPAR